MSETIELAGHLITAPKEERLSLHAQPLPQFMPFNDFFLVSDLTDSGDERTPTGLFIPNTIERKDKLLELEVIATSDGVLGNDGLTMRKPRVNVGDKVFIALSSVHHQSAIRWGNQMVRILTESDIVGILPAPPEQ